MRKKSRETKTIDNLDENFQFRNELSKKLSVSIIKNVKLSKENINCLEFDYDVQEEKE